MCGYKRRLSGFAPLNAERGCLSMMNTCDFFFYFCSRIVFSFFFFRNFFPFVRSVYTQFAECLPRTKWRTYRSSRTSCSWQAEHFEKRERAQIIWRKLAKKKNEWKHTHENHNKLAPIDKFIVDDINEYEYIHVRFLLLLSSWLRPPFFQIPMLNFGCRQICICPYGIFFSFVVHEHLQPQVGCFATVCLIQETFVACIFMNFKLFFVAYLLCIFWSDFFSSQSSMRCIEFYFFFIWISLLQLIVCFEALPFRFFVWLAARNAFLEHLFVSVNFI